MLHTFERAEKKYLLTPAQYDTLCAALHGRMTQDAYGLHTVGNLYLDTDDWAVIRASIEKPVYKEKLRLRAYGRPKAESPAFLELKKKLDGVVYKRRAALPYAQALRCAREGGIAKPGTQILSEMDWTMRRLALSPRACLCYDRRALYAPQGPGLRVTFDENIRFRLTDLDLAHGSWGAPLLPDARVLMEVKTLGSVPVWFARLLSEIRTAPTGFSKYGIVYASFISGGGEAQEGGLANVC